jgi:hypothetical protein
LDRIAYNRNERDLSKFTDECKEKYNGFFSNDYLSMIAKINAMEIDEINTLIAKDECPYQSEIDSRPGMFHCPLCGEMLLGGQPHIRYGEFRTSSLEGI